MSAEQFGYGGSFVSDNDKSLQSKSGGTFGLNRGNLTKFAFNPNAAKEGETPRAAIDIEVTIGDNIFKSWVNPITKVFGKNQEELTDNTTEEYKKAYFEMRNQQYGTVTHYLKAVGVSEENIKRAMETATSFESWAQNLVSLLPGDFSTRPVDVFLEYQWKIGLGQDRTFLKLPDNMKGGRFITPHVAGEFEAVHTPEGLKYVHKENKSEHPFARNKNFMESNKAKQQGVGANNGPAPVSGNGQSAINPGNGAAKKSSWD